MNINSIMSYTKKQSERYRLRSIKIQECLSTPVVSNLVSNNYRIQRIWKLSLIEVSRSIQKVQSSSNLLTHFQLERIIHKYCINKWDAWKVMSLKTSIMEANSHLLRLQPREYLSPWAIQFNNNLLNRQMIFMVSNSLINTSTKISILIKISPKTSWRRNIWQYRFRVELIKQPRILLSKVQIRSGWVISRSLRA